MNLSKTVASFVLIANLITTKCVFAADYIELVDSKVAMPPVAPNSVSRTGSFGQMFPFLKGLVPLFNDKVIRAALQANFEETARAAFIEADRLGQPGVLLRIDILSQDTAAGPYLSLRGGGVSFIGVGPNVDAVCFADRCYETPLGGITTAGDQTLAPGSDYVWIVRDAKKFKVNTYDRSAVQNRARQIRLDAGATASYKAIVRSEAVAAYAVELQKSIKNRRDRAEIESLLKNYRENIEQRKRLERELSEEMLRAERAAKVSETLTSITLAFSLASAIQLVSASLGKDITSQSSLPIDSKEALRKVIETIKSSSERNVESMHVRLQTLRDTNSGYESSIVEMGFRFGQAPAPGTVFKPLP